MTIYTNKRITFRTAILVYIRSQYPTAEIEGIVGYGPSEPIIIPSVYQLQEFISDLLEPRRYACILVPSDTPDNDDDIFG